MESTPTRKPSEMTPTEKFFRYFQNEVTELQKEMERLQDHAATGGERADAIEHCLAGIARLSGEVQDASSFLPAYDQRTYGEAIKALSNKLQDVRNSLAPRPKFSFKSAPTFSVKKNASAISLGDAAELANQRRKQILGHSSSEQSSASSHPGEGSSMKSEQDVDSTLNHNRGGDSQHHNAGGQGMVVGDKTDTLIDTTEVNPDSARSGTFVNLRRCVVDMSRADTSSQTFATLTLKNIADSLLICGHVSGAVHITNVSNSVIVVATRQFRMHESRGCSVYLHCASRPIIEDCSEIKFAPLPALYATGEDCQTQNQWHQVDDFKWLRNEPSPNWKLLESPFDEDLWKTISKADGRMSVDETLKAVKLEK